MLHAIRETLREKRLLHTMVFMVIAIMLVCILAFSVLFRRYVDDVLAPKIMQQNEAMLNINTAAFDDILAQCVRVSVAIENDRYFTAEYISTRATAFIDITKRLSNYTSFIAGVEDIFFVNANHNQIYTSQGVYNPVYFSSLQRMDAAGHTWLFRDNLRFGQPAYFASLIGNGLLFQNASSVVEYVLPVQYGRGLLGFRIYTSALLPGAADLLLLLEDGSGQLLYYPARSLDAGQAGELLRTVLEEDAPSGTLTIAAGRYFYAVHASSASSARLLYLMPYDAYMAEIRGINLLFFSTSAGVLLLCSLLGIVLLHYAYAPVRRMRQTLSGAPVEIPPGLNEADSMHYALSALGDQYDALSQSHRMVRRAQVLRRLLSRDTQGDFAADCQAADIRMQGRHLMILMLSVTIEDEARAQQIADDAVFLLSRRQEVVLMEYARRLSFALLLLSDAPIAEDYLASVADHLSAKHAKAFALGISAPYRQHDRTHHAFQEARIAARACDKLDTRSYCFFATLTSPAAHASPYPRTEIEGLQDAIVNQQPEHIATLVEVLLRSVREESQSSLAFCLCYDIANAMLHAARKNPSLAARLAGYPRFAYEAIEFVSMEDFAEFIHALTQLILENLDDCPELYRRAEAFIEEHIADMSLYADSVAEHFEVSVQKINQLYKARTGQTLTAHIAHRRHAYIKRMLITSELTIHALALQMGYSQASSFVRYFKQEEGMPPGEYRARYRRPQGEGT